MAAVPWPGSVAGRREGGKGRLIRQAVPQLSGLHSLRYLSWMSGKPPPAATPCWPGIVATLLAAAPL